MFLLVNKQYNTIQGRPDASLCPVDKPMDSASEKIIISQAY